MPHHFEQIAAFLSSCTGDFSDRFALDCAAFVTWSLRFRDKNMAKGTSRVIAQSFSRFEHLFV